GVPAWSALAVVRAELAVVGLVAVRIGIELGSVLDLLLRPVDVDLLVLRIDAVDHACRQHGLLPEDPRAGVDHHEARADVVARLVDLADAAVECLDAVPGEVRGAQRLLAVGPDLYRRHSYLLRCL